MYGTLEPIPWRSDSGKQVVQDDDKQVVQNDGKQVVQDGDKQVVQDVGKQVVQDDGKQILSTDNGQIEPVLIGSVVIEKPDAPNDQIKPPRYLRRREIALILALSSLIILAIVIGGVLGSKKRLATKLTVPYSPGHRNIAALSFAPNSINQTRVYFQNDEGHIVEASNSANTSWSIKIIGDGARNSSALAAAVSRPGFPLEISIFYLDEWNFIHDLIYNSSSNTWDSGIISNQKYQTMSDSKLTAAYYQCEFCVNATLIAFQDKNGLVQIGNFTSDNWTLSQLDPALDPAANTGLALIQYSDPYSPASLNLFHQKSSLHMSVAWWRPNRIESVDGWKVDANIYDDTPSNDSFIAAASSYSNTNTNFSTWVERLAISNRGVQVSAKSEKQWIQQGANPSVMANSTTNRRNYGSVAVTAIGSAFGVVMEQSSVDRIEYWQMEDDMIDWKLIGNLNLGDSWKTSSFAF